MFTIQIKDLGKYDNLSAGGKGASLGEMMNNDIPVPGGFVILASTFDNFLKITDINIAIDAILSKTDKNKIHTVDDTSERITSLVLGVKMPSDIETEVLREFKKLNSPFVAVRSSATAEDSASAAWAGQLDSFLNTNENSLLENVKKCWASLFTPRAIFYRFEQNLHKQKVSVAVVVQKMINSELSGVAFSVHPVTEDCNQIIIEGSYGLGEAIVSGQVTPDSYVVKKEPREIIDKNVTIQTRGLYRKADSGNEWRDIPSEIAENQVLTDKQILELSEIIIRIEKHYDFPCDIEWVFEDDKFYIVQSRPITTLSNKRCDVAEVENGAIKSLQSNAYDLNFTASGFSVQTLDWIFNNNDTYGEVDYVVLYQDDITHWYLSEFGKKECFNISAQLLDDNFYNQLIKDSKNLLKKFKNYKTIILNENNVNQEFEETVKISNEFSRVYRFYDQPFQQALETAVLKVVPENTLIEMLASKNFSMIKDAKIQKYIQRLVDMGKTQLQLHYDSERFVMDEVFVNYASSKVNLPTHLIKAMQLKEFRDALNGKISVEISDLKERLKGCVFVKVKNAWQLCTGEKYKHWREKINKIKSEKIKGNIAYKGAAMGKVKIHLSWMDVTEIEEGDILVAGMTNPQMIPMLKKAAAIVTDQGGITCHAAIIARELRKPCIVGTKNATQILKDGDIVEVNAYNGVVKILHQEK